MFWVGSVLTAICRGTENSKFGYFPFPKKIWYVITGFFDVGCGGLGCFWLHFGFVVFVGSSFYFGGTGM